MKTLKADATIIVTGWFRKRYWIVIPLEGVYELPINTVKDQLAGKVKAWKQNNG